MHVLIKIKEKYLKGEDITEQDIDKAIKNSLKTMKCTLLLSGSALKNKGIQLLLDSIVKYLPSPLEREKIESTFKHKKVTREPNNRSKLLAYAFKIINDNVHGPISFVRTYSGQLKSKSTLFNTTTNKIEKINLLARPLADEMTHINVISAGDIGAIVGNNGIRSGDTLILDGDKEKIELEGMYKHQAMFTCAINSKDKKDENKLMQVLEKMTKEDPSLIIGKNEETGQIFINAVGELQLEILQNRILKEYGIRMKYGKLRVSYRESILNKIRKKLVLEKMHAGQNIFAELEIEVEPLSAKAKLGTNEYAIDIEKLNKTEIVEINKYDPKYEGIQASVETFKSIDSLSEESQFMIQEAFSNSLLSGKILGYKMIGVKITLKGGRWSNLRTSDLALKLCAAELANVALREATPCLLEPYVETNIILPEPCIQEILADISVNRRGEVRQVEEIGLDTKKSSSKKKITATFPLSELSGYANYIRTVTKGQGSYTAEFCDYQPVSEEKLKKIMENPFM